VFVIYILHNALEYVGIEVRAVLRLECRQLKVVAIIQARLGSTRLPGKALLDIAGSPMLARVVERTKRARMLDSVIVATTVKLSDDPIARLCEDSVWPCFRGSEEDVLDRYFHAAQLHQADVVVRITSDCPLVDPQILDSAIKVYLRGQPSVDYVSNGFPSNTFPRGLDVEVVRFAALKKAWQEDNNMEWREHVTPYIYYHPELFQIEGVTNDIDYSGMRWTVDTPEDLELIRTIYSHFGHDHFSWRDVIEAIDKNPHWLDINRHIRQKLI
jgi:spore coat polysaccharide biosynthesis protein SpsF